ncbi:hypothetical protein [Nonomuraea sp. NPDC049158]|uniref:hypothetical protein n=1 Tax=Nonomuraea sp. NPDC049158 TaxID=3155649 RepID=UPI0033D16F59
MAHTPHDKTYRKVQARLVHEAADGFEQPDWGTEDPRARRDYDRELRRTMPVDGKGKRR